MQRQIFVNLGNLLLSLSEITDYANPYIAQHQQRTAFIALEIARYSGIDGSRLGDIFTAALLHDIGAISVEEKTSIHKVENLDNKVHAVKGEILLNKTSFFKNVSGIVGNHHREWRDWDQAVTDPDVYASQVILLADLVERLIDRNKYILYQYKDIIEYINKLDDGIVNNEIIKSFNEAAKREEFWLDLISPRLFPLLLNNGPYYKAEISINEIFNITELFRDIIDFKSPFTATHTTGVAACAEKLSKLFGFSELEVNLMKIAGNFHDIGKLIIPNSILEKPGKLTSDEYAIMKSHTYYTYYVIDTIGGLRQVAEWAAYHHEKLNGNGYPFHCKSEEIDNGSRIIAVADIFTALSEDRPYRNGMGKEDIYKIMDKMVLDGSIDKRIVDLLFDNYAYIESYVNERQLCAKEYYESKFINASDLKNK